MITVIIIVIGMIAMIITIIIVMLTMILIIFAIPTHLWARSMHADICGPNGFARMGACCAHIRCMLCSHPFVCPAAQIPPQLRSPRSCGPAVPRSHGPAVPRSCGPRSCSPSVLLPWLIARWLGVLSRPCSGPRSVVQGRGPTSSTWSGSAVCQTG